MSTFSQARSIVRQIRTQDNRIEKLIDGQKKYEKPVKKDYEQALQESIINQLKQTSVDEMAKAKLGIRIAVLKENGIDNIYQLQNMNVKTLEAINGIGPKSAASIVDVVKTITGSVSNNAKIRFDMENQTGIYDRLMSGLYKYIRMKQVGDKAQEWYEQYHKETRELIKKSAPARNWFLWQFASDEKKTVAIENLEKLEELLSGDYKAQADALFEEAQNALKAKHEEYWGHYGRNSASYYTSLEKIKSGRNSKNQEMAISQEVAVKNGLPEELAIAIGQVELDLTGLKCDLRPYQRYGVQYILNQGAVLLGDDMGLGKTVEAIAAMVALSNSGATHFMVVCPASVLINWNREIAKFSELTIIKMHGKTATEECQNWIKNGGVGVTTYETLGKMEIPEEFSFDMLIVDEAHYAKNPKAARTENLLYFRQHTDRALYMTGTPIENNVEEMCFLIGCLKPSVAKSVEGSTSMALAPEFRRRVSSVYFRRTKEDVLTELPEKIEYEEWCDLEQEEKTLYKKYVYEGNFSGMRQVSWMIEDSRTSSKALRMQELVDDYLKREKKIIIFSFYLNTMEQVGKLFREYNVYGPITGQISPQERQEIIDEFSASEGGAILLSQIQAGGTGLNIQAASVIIFCEPQLKPSIENQAIARAYRMGQVNTVMVHRLLCDNTVDEQILNILKNKQDIFDNFAHWSESGQESVSEMRKEQEIGQVATQSIIEAEKQRIEEETGEL